VGHDDDLVVAQLREIEVVGANARAERGDHQPDFFGGQHLVEARLFDVEDLALERKNRLEAPVATLLRRSTCRVALDEEDLGPFRIALLTVCELSGKRSRVEGALPSRQLASFPGRLTRTRSFDDLLDDPSRVARSLFEIFTEPLVDHLLNPRLDVRRDA